jgi:hypothetical protein
MIEVGRNFKRSEVMEWSLNCPHRFRNLVILAVLERVMRRIIDVINDMVRFSETQISGNFNTTRISCNFERRWSMIMKYARRKAYMYCYT